MKKILQIDKDLNQCWGDMLCKRTIWRSIDEIIEGSLSPNEYKVYKENLIDHPDATPLDIMRYYCGYDIQQSFVLGFQLKYGNSTPSRNYAWEFIK